MMPEPKPWFFDLDQSAIVGAWYCFQMSQHPLAREVALIVAVKTAIVITAGFLLFGPRQRPIITTDSVERHLFPASESVVAKHFGESIQ